MIRQSNYINLKELYEFVSQDYDHAFSGRTSYGKKYSKLVTKITNSIPEKPGFYLWGSYNSNGSWNYIYIGKAGTKPSTSLRNRIKEELKDERQFLWLRDNDESTIDEFGLKYYPKMWPIQYRKNTERALKKFNSTYIIWVDHLSKSESPEDEISNLESNLIAELKPTANSMKPKPPMGLQDHVDDIIQHFKKHINENSLDGRTFIPKKKNAT